MFSTRIVGGCDAGKVPWYVQLSIQFGNASFRSLTAVLNIENAHVFEIHFFICTFSKGPLAIFPNSSFV
jgi:hypothetical protein